MRTMRAGDIAALINANGHSCELVGSPDTLVGPDVVIDSRQAGPGSIFVALPGEQVDGHDYLDQAAANGALLALVNQDRPAPLGVIRSADAQEALTALARGLVAMERERGMTTFAITGSSGKTSTKDLLAQILLTQGTTVSPVGSFNNELGTPLTACAVQADTRFLVAEMGSRGLGHISLLCSIVPPDIATVINVGTAHLGEFGSQETIAQAKGEIIEAASAWAVLNADDPLVNAMAGRAKARIARFSADDAATPRGDLVVRAGELMPDDLQRYGFTLHANGRKCRVQLKVVGRHQVTDALAAATAALAAGLPLDAVGAALDQATSRSPWRMEVHELANGAAVINDAYNANPDSMAAALATLAQMRQARRAHRQQARAIAILGDMLELGEGAAELHHRLGQQAADLGIDEVYAVGGYADQVAEGVARSGGRAHVVTQSELVDRLELHEGDVVLVKASRGLRLEKVADQLIGEKE